MSGKNKIRAIIVDDSQQARKLLRLMVHELSDEVVITGEAENVMDGVELIRSLKPDVVFLDIEMPGKSGLKLPEEISKSEYNYEIIFTTAYNEHAIQAFRLSAIDYLLKPINENQLKESLHRVVQQRTAFQSAVRMNALTKNLAFQKDNVLCVPVDYGYEYIPVNEIECIEADGSYAHIFTADKKQKTISKNLKYFESALEHLPAFVKVHRSFIVNRQFIIALQKTERATIILKSGRMVDISRSRRKEIIELLDGRP